jgi:ribosomal protein S18 acetylase RimI-like enzyme
MLFRPYTLSDRADCLAVFDSNALRFFSPGDRDEFARFLEAPPGFFGVLCDHAGGAVGCGGIALSKADARVAALTWGMIYASQHGLGWGRLLTLARLRHLVEMPAVEKVVLHTSHATARFYRKIGFREVNVVPNGYCEGLDRQDMELLVDAEFRRRLGALDGDSRPRASADSGPVP